MKYFVYILYSKKLDKYYIGTSHDPEKRLKYHNIGKKGWTKRGIPWELAFQKEFRDKLTAMKEERQIKNQKSKKYIEKLISGEYTL